MGIGDRLKNIFKKKDVVEEVPELPKPDFPRLDVSTVSMRTEPGSVSTDTMKAKMDLVVAHIEGLKIQYETLNARIERMERMLQEIYAIAKR